jgi:hypothetical protein
MDFHVASSTPLYNIGFLSCITSNVYFKILFVIVLGLTITFVDEIEVLHNKGVVIALLCIALLLSSTHLDELGAVILVIILMILVFNIERNKQREMT